MSGTILSDLLMEIIEEYKKMRVLRRVAEEYPTGIIDDILKILDEAWEKDKEIQKLQPPTNENN